MKGFIKVTNCYSRQSHVVNIANISKIKPRKDGGSIVIVVGDDRHIDASHEYSESMDEVMEMVDNAIT